MISCSSFKCCPDFYVKRVLLWNGKKETTGFFWTYALWNLYLVIPPRPLSPFYFTLQTLNSLLTLVIKEVVLTINARDSFYWTLVFIRRLWWHEKDGKKYFMLGYGCNPSWPRNFFFSPSCSIGFVAIFKHLTVVFLNALLPILLN